MPRLEDALERHPALGLLAVLLMALLMGLEGVA